MVRRRRPRAPAAFLVAAGVFFSTPAGALILQEAGERGTESRGFLGLPVWAWKAANMLLFFGLLAWFLARPVSGYFKKRQEEIEENLKRAQGEREEAHRLASEMHQRLDRLEVEIEEIRNRGRVDGEREKATLIEEGDRAALRVRRDAEEEIGRRLASARAELAHTGADLVARVAREIVEKSLTPEDRRRMVEAAIEKLGKAL